MKILILANHYNTLRIFRRELIISFAEMGHEIILSIPQCDDRNKAILESYGARVVFTEVDRRGTNPLRDIKLFNSYKRLLRTEKPDKVIAYTIKCNVYGGLACKRAHIPFYANVTGLGSAFQGQSLMRRLVSFLYKHSLNKAEAVFFENVGNRDTLVDDGLIRADQAHVLPGAGVNLNEFQSAAYPDSGNGINFLFVGRIMREKGVDELFSAIEHIKAKYDSAQFNFIGWYEDNYEQKVKEMSDKGLLEFHGFQNDVKPFILASHCVVLPSWHEGMSNTLLESAAMCRPLITSDIHGCKEAVVDGISGLLTKVKDADALYEAIEKIILMSNDERVAMGIRGRRHMIERFDKEKVVETTKSIIFK